MPSWVDNVIIIAFLILAVVGAILGFVHYKSMKKIKSLIKQRKEGIATLKKNADKIDQDAQAERKVIEEKIRNESRQNVVNLFFDRFRRNPMGGSSG